MSVHLIKSFILYTLITFSIILNLWGFLLGIDRKRSILYENGDISAIPIAWDCQDVVMMITFCDGEKHTSFEHCERDIGKVCLSIFPINVNWKN